MSATGEAMRARAERFGAWVRADDATLVAVSRPAARGRGGDGGALWSAAAADQAPRPLEVHLAVTARCAAGCTGCYLDARPDGEAPPLEVLVERLRAIAAGGAFTVALGGGEPLSRPDLPELARAARALGLVPVMTTSGLGLTRERARALGDLAQVNVSWDGEGEDYAAVRGWGGAPVAERAMELLGEASIPFGVNVVLTRATFARLERTAERAEELGACEVQLLRYKPAGRARDASYLAARLSPDQIDALHPTLERIVGARSIPVRIDCATVPLLSGHALDAAALERFGVFGCEAGRHLSAVRVDGRVAPCSFAPGTELSAGEAFGAGWESNATLDTWRRPHEREPCRSCPLRRVCRGGCRVVALHLDGELGPDPECPRVRQHVAVSGAAGPR